MFVDAVLTSVVQGIRRDVAVFYDDKSPSHLEDEMQRMKKGFTLIELLIVVVIIGILAAIAIPKFANTKSKAYITAMKSDLRNLVTAEEAYFSDSTHYTTAVISYAVFCLKKKQAGLAADPRGRPPRDDAY